MKPESPISKSQRIIEIIVKANQVAVADLIHALIEEQVEPVRRELARLQGEAAPEESVRSALSALAIEAPKKNGQGASSYWAQFTPEERSAEMKRRVAKRSAKLHPRDKRHPEHEKWVAKMREVTKRAWDNLSPYKRKQKIASLRQAREQRVAIQIGANSRLDCLFRSRLSRYARWHRGVERVSRHEHQAQRSARAVDQLLRHVELRLDLQSQGCRMKDEKGVLRFGDESGELGELTTEAPGDGDELEKHRFTFRLCHEVTHFLFEEQKRRKALGLPHTAINDIVEEGLLEHFVECRKLKLSGIFKPRTPFKTNKKAKAAKTGESK